VAAHEEAVLVVCGQLHELLAPRRSSSRPEEQLAELDREIEYSQRRAELDRLKREADGEPAS
jgi:hypothetical protein